MVDSIDPKLLERQFKDKLPVFKRLEEEALFTLETALKVKNIRLHSITHRTKTIESFLDKVQRKQSGKPFEEINDVVGLRVICLFLSDIANIGEEIRKCFNVVSEDNKIEGNDVSSFGYLSVHFIVTIKKECSGPRYHQLVGLPFEIQVRTIAMDAWATISHYLDYKSEMDIPKQLRRDFYALNALLYVADTHFEMFFKLRQESRENMVVVFKSKPGLEEEINLDSLTAYLHKRFPDRKHSDSQTVSDLVQELSEAGYQYIGEIEHVLNTAWNAFLIWEEEVPPATGEKRFTDVGVVRKSLYLIDDNYCELKGIHIPDKKYISLLKK